MIVTWLQCQTCPTGLSFSPDGKLMATLAKDRKVRERFSSNLKIVSTAIETVASAQLLQWFSGRVLDLSINLHLRG